MEAKTAVLIESHAPTRGEILLRWDFTVWTKVSNARTVWLPAIIAVLVLGAADFAAAQALFESRRVTPPGEYTGMIEGPAVDAAGMLYVVNFQKNGNIGKLPPGAAKSALFAALPAGSIGNGIRFDRDGRMYVADFKKHNVFVFERGKTAPQVYFHSDQFNQPNDLAIAADGTLYASDPKFGPNTGQIWQITRGPDGKGRGTVMSSERMMGTTNGIDLSPDGQSLYVSESATHELWAYQLQDAKLLAPRLLMTFDTELDGLRTDVDGRIFLTRPGHGTVAVVTPQGNLVREIPVRGKTPSNLTFGGPDGSTVFVTQVDGRFIEAFRTDRPGREFCQGAPGPACQAVGQP
jgi:signal peptidase